MKLVVFAALVAAVASLRLGTNKVDNQWPWETGKLYRYNVHTNTLARLEEGASTGVAFRAHFIVRSRAPGHLQAKLEKPEHAQIHQELPNTWAVPEDLKYQEVKNMDQPFEIYLDGGRVQSLSLPTTVSLSHENLLKGLISALQVDLSAHRNVHSAHDSHDQEMQQGLYRKMETDVTGDCETLYAVSPVASEWRRELPDFISAEQPFEVTKTRDYKHCHHRVAYHFGVPENAKWTGTSRDPKQEQLMNHKTYSRILIGKQGPIYKSETTSTVHVSPHLYQKQKAEVRSKVVLTLESFEEDKEAEWQIPEGSRPIKNLLYALSSKQVDITDSSSSSSSESHEHKQHQSEQSEEVNNRVRRSMKMPRKIVSINKIIVNKRSDESSSSSSSDSTSAYVNDDLPRINEPAYASLYMSPQPHVDKKQNPMNAQKLVQEIAQQLQNPNNMPKADFLSKFNILVRVIAAMSSEQLSQTSRSIEVAKSSNNIMKHDMWMIYRDAVVQAGTMPAFQQIKTWIQNKKIQGEEAAQVIANLPVTLRYPTKEVMLQFFKLAMSPEVMEQKYLNSTALIAATRFINWGQVNNETAHMYYPTHMYGRFVNQHDNFVLEQILPRLSDELQKSIQNGDHKKAHVYIIAIGFLGHRSILDVFAPYIEGKIPVSTYLRASMVEVLQVLAYQKDHYARALLYSILRNTAEPYEVRVLAAQGIIFTSEPTGAMLQAMAEMTQQDPSLHVRAALKGGILALSKIKTPRYMYLAKLAQAAVPSLTKDDLGSLNWGKRFSESFEQRDQLVIMNMLNYVSSEDSLFPKNLQYSWIGGWHQLNTIATSFSSYRQFVDQLMQKMKILTQDTPKSTADYKYSADKINQMLNIKHDPQEPLEASFFIFYMNQLRYFSLTEDDMNQLPAEFGKFMANLEKGIDAHYTKVFYHAQFSIMFPVASGMPFIYKYKEPSVIHIQGKTKGQINFPSVQHPEYSSSMEQEIQFTYAKNIEGSVGFLDTLGNQYASAGIVNKYQVNIPIKVQAQAKMGEVKIRLEPLQPDQDTTIAYFSVWPYTANQNKDTLTPVSLDPTTKVITRINKVVSLDTKFGQVTGNTFQLQGYSYSKDYRNFASMLQSKDLLTNIMFAFRQRDVAMTHFNFKYLGKQSQNKAVVLNVAYDTLYNQKQPELPVVASELPDVTPVPRRQEIVKRAVAGINTARAHVLDLTATFEGPQQVEFVLTAAIGDSKIDRKVRSAFYAGRNSEKLGKHQVNGVTSMIMPPVTVFNFLEALKKELKTSFEADFNLGKDKGHIQVKGYLDRTEKATALLKESPLWKQAIEETTHNDFYQTAGRRMSMMAHVPNHMKASITFKDISPVLFNITYQAYKTMMGSWYSDVNPFKKAAKDVIEIEAEISFWDYIMNWDMLSQYGHLKMSNIPIPKFAPSALTVHKPLDLHERVLNLFTGHQYLPHCTVDGSKIKTFSNRSYDYTVTRSWHVVLLDDAKYAGQYGYKQEQLVLLARRPEEKKQEMYISYKSDTGKDLEVEIKPAADKPIVKVTTNAKLVSEGELIMYWDDVKDTPLLQYYMLDDGVLMLHIGEKRLRLMYDGQRLVVFTNENRNNVRGICGYMSGEPRDDYLTPYGLVDKPELYAVSYTLNDENADPNTVKMLAEVKKYAYQPLNQYTAVLRSDDAWKNAMHSSSSSSEEHSYYDNVYRSRSYLKQQGPCELQQQVQFYENHGEICISTTQVPACQSHCKGVDYQVQPVQVVCRPKLDKNFQEYRNEIQKGGNPQVTGVPQIKQYRVPTSCKA